MSAAKKHNDASERARRGWETRRAREAVERARNESRARKMREIWANRSEARKREIFDKAKAARDARLASVSGRIAGAPSAGKSGGARGGARGGGGGAGVGGGGFSSGVGARGQDWGDEPDYGWDEDGFYDADEETEY